MMHTQLVSPYSTRARIKYGFVLVWRIHSKMPISHLRLSTTTTTEIIFMEWTIENAENAANGRQPTDWHRWSKIYPQQKKERAKRTEKGRLLIEPLHVEGAVKKTMRNADDGDTAYDGRHGPHSIAVNIDIIMEVTKSFFFFSLTPFLVAVFFLSHRCGQKGFSPFFRFLSRSRYGSTSRIEYKRIRSINLCAS